MEINLQIDISAIEKKAQAEMDARLNSVTSSHINELLRKEFKVRGAITESKGALMALIQEKIESYALSERFEKLIEERIDALAPDAIDEALRSVLRHTAKRGLFRSINSD